MKNILKDFNIRKDNFNSIIECLELVQERIELDSMKCGDVVVSVGSDRKAVVRFFKVSSIDKVYETLDRLLMEAAEIEVNFLQCIFAKCKLDLTKYKNITEVLINDSAIEDIDVSKHLKVFKINNCCIKKTFGILSIDREDLVSTMLGDYSVCAPSSLCCRVPFYISVEAMKLYMNAYSDICRKIKRKVEHKVEYSTLLILCEVYVSVKNSGYYVGMSEIEKLEFLKFVYMDTLISELKYGGNYREWIHRTSSVNSIDNFMSKFVKFNISKDRLDDKINLCSDIINYRYTKLKESRYKSYGSC